ncbi:hypothetical protein GCM10023116_22420 [Kistimonas scapharcae]|uniref:Uncharacterized protein n=1 Tax=Kistimonas scapharcae TaxID=1036133 RepID=A0ABP8V1S5_9GAMM
MRRFSDKQNRDSDLQELVDTFNSKLLKTQSHTDHPTPEKLRHLRCLVIETTRNFLVLQSFPSGNKESAMMLNIMLCRLAGAYSGLLEHRFWST